MNKLKRAGEIFTDICISIYFYLKSISSETIDFISNVFKAFGK